MEVSIRRWGAGDLPLLEQCLGDPRMTEHLGGPESRERLAGRHARFLAPESRQFAILFPDGGEEGVGCVGYWEREWQGEPVYETGWSVIPAFQGRGIARAAMALLLDRAREEATRPSMHAYPSVDNAPSNALCRGLGFSLKGPVEFEYPKGHLMRCNDWRLELRTS